MAENPLLSVSDKVKLKTKLTQAVNKNIKEARDQRVQEALLELEQCQKKIDKTAISQRNVIDEIIQTVLPILSKKEQLCQKRNDLLNKIPKFWSITICNATKTVSLFTKDEIECFKYVSGFVIEEFKDNQNLMTGLKVEISFEETNPFFENKTVSKTVSYTSERASSSTPLIWKEKGSVLSNKTKNESFFDWLNEGLEGFPVKLMHILELWEDPLRYYILSPNCETDSEFQNPDLKHIFEEIIKCQSEINELNKKAYLERNKNRAKSDHERCNRHFNDDLYEIRNAIIEMIPNFWVSVFRGNPCLNLLLGEEEIDCLKYLKRIDFGRSPTNNSNHGGVTVQFHFSEDNPYVAKSVVSKTYYRDENLKLCSEVTPVLWKENEFLAKKFNGMTLPNKSEDSVHCNPTISKKKKSLVKNFKDMTLTDKRGDSVHCNPTISKKKKSLVKKFKDMTLTDKHGGSGHCNLNESSLFDLFKSIQPVEPSEFIFLAIIEIIKNPLKFYNSETVTGLDESTKVL